MEFLIDAGVLGQTPSLTHLLEFLSKRDLVHRFLNLARKFFCIRCIRGVVGTTDASVLTTRRRCV